MEPKIIKEQMTKGEWYRMGYKVTQYTADEGNKLLALCESHDFSTVEDKANAAAIVSAVNSTWGRSINPEKVPDILDMLEVLYSNFKKDMDYDLDERVEALINSAKL